MVEGEEALDESALPNVSVYYPMGDESMLNLESRLRDDRDRN